MRPARLHRPAGAGARARLPVALPTFVWAARQVVLPAVLPVALPTLVWAALQVAVPGSTSSVPAGRCGAAHMSGNVPRCPEWESNPHWMVFETIGSASWPIGACGSSCHPPLGSLGGRRAAPGGPHGGHRRGRGADPAGPAGDARGGGLPGRRRGRRRRDRGRPGHRAPPRPGRPGREDARLDGISAAERIAAARIAPVVMLTAFSQRELVERARAAGAMAYLVKPFSKADLVPGVEMAMARFDELTALESQVTDLQERLETRKLVDRAKGRPAGPARARRGRGLPLGAAHLDGPPAHHAPGRRAGAGGAGVRPGVTGVAAGAPEVTTWQRP